MKKRRRTNFNRKFKNRTIGIFLISLIMLFVFAARMIYLYNSIYKTKAAEQRTRILKIPAKRGQILDSSGNVLAKNVKVNCLYYFPQDLKEDSRNKIINGFSTILDMSGEEIDKVLASKKTVRVKENLTSKQVKEIRDLGENSLSLTVENRRYYPEGTSLSYVLGFTNSDGEGLYGVENFYDNFLKGKYGLNIFAGSRNGSLISFEDNREVKSHEGKNITLNIEQSISGIIGNILRDAQEKYSPKSISVIVTNPMTNKVIAMENSPRFDSNNPRKGRTEEEQKELDGLKDKEKLNKLYDIWRNRCISDIYEPGSVYKLITAAVGLEEGVFTERDTYECKGYYNITKGVTIKCYRWYDPHGIQTMEEALANSCNPSFAQMAEQIGYAKMHQYLKAFGFGDLTGIDLIGEQKGLIPSSASSMNIAQLVTMSYGHGIAATPIQVITACNALINGGYLITPTIANKIDGKELHPKEELVKRQVISQKTSERMKALMVNNVENGGANAVKSPYYSVGGKSGTTIKLENGVYTSEKTVASFYSAFPMEKPEFSVLVVVDEPKGMNSGNAVAGDIAKRVNDEIAKLKNINKGSSTESELTDIDVPNFVGETLRNAVNIANSKGIKIEIINTSDSDGIIIKGQSVDAGAKINKNKVISLIADDSGEAAVKIPELVGKYKNEALSILKDTNLKITHTGDSEKSRIIKTNPPVNDFIRQGDTLELIYEPIKKKKDEKKKENTEDNSQEQEDVENEESKKQEEENINDSEE
ncbi:penicillin-binding transpeptidase domain-containing protein [Lagierella sp.]|uniref:penicillin-binding transpeptidase domain-containing protein n=1 Tax=Lagierella sp. TaxID=2849657 RepID=UPI002609CA9D|nr:penicillin-binding transpeptidase domain-containing protein [Lagierella sp.]